MRTQQCDKKACHLTTLAVKHCQIELAKPLRVTEDVDLGNLPTQTVKAMTENNFPSSMQTSPGRR